MTVYETHAEGAATSLSTLDSLCRATFMLNSNKLNFAYGSFKCAVETDFTCVSST